MIQKNMENSYDGINYCPMACRGNTDIVKTDTGVCVTSLEQTVIDSIADFEKVGLEAWKKELSLPELFF